MSVAEDIANLTAQLGYEVDLPLVAASDIAVTRQLSCI